MYLIWFDRQDRPAAAREAVLLFRNGKPVTRSDRPGRLLEAVQHCAWELEELSGIAVDETVEDEEFLEQEAPSYKRFHDEWWSEDPKSTWGGKTRVALSPLAVGTGPSRKIDTREPSWMYPETPPGLAIKGDRSGRYVRRVVQGITSLLLARPEEPEVWTPALESLRLDHRWKTLRSAPPLPRYERFRDFIERYGQSPETRPSLPRPAGIEWWNVVELANMCRHAFPTQWLTRFSAPQASWPGFCYFARNWWVAALIEIAWAVEHDVWARQCQHPGCEVWFLQAGRQGKRRLYCERHKATNTGATRRYRETLRTRFPQADAIKKQRRNLVARKRRGTISEAEYQKQDAELERTLRQYRSSGLAPAGRRTGISDLPPEAQKVWLETKREAQQRQSPAEHRKWCGQALPNLRQRLKSPSGSGLLRIELEKWRSFWWAHV